MGRAEGEVTARATHSKCPRCHSKLCVKDRGRPANDNQRSVASHGDPHGGSQVNAPKVEQASLGSQLGNAHVASDHHSTGCVDEHTGSCYLAGGTRRVGDGQRGGPRRVEQQGDVRGVVHLREREEGTCGDKLGRPPKPHQPCVPSDNRRALYNWDSSWRWQCPPRWVTAGSRGGHQTN